MIDDYNIYNLIIYIILHSFYIHKGIIGINVYGYDTGTSALNPYSFSFARLVALTTSPTTTLASVNSTELAAALLSDSTAIDVTTSLFAKLPPPTPEYVILF